MDIYAVWNELGLPPAEYWDSGVGYSLLEIAPPTSERSDGSTRAGCIHLPAHPDVRRHAVERTAHAPTPNHGKAIA
jgi:hypothetical protein